MEHMSTLDFAVIFFKKAVRNNEEVKYYYRHFPPPNYGKIYYHSSKACNPIHGFSHDENKIKSIIQRYEIKGDADYAVFIPFSVTVKVNFPPTFNLHCHAVLYLRANPLVQLQFFICKWEQ